VRSMARATEESNRVGASMAVVTEGAIQPFVRLGQRKWSEPGVIGCSVGLDGENKREKTKVRLLWQHRCIDTEGNSP
jgi:hypothetical protein